MNVRVPRLGWTVVSLSAAVLAAALTGPVWAGENADQQDAIRGLVKQLGDDSFKVREVAQKKLTEIGPAAIPQLERALESSDLEVNQRAKTILQALYKQAKESRSAAVRKSLRWTFPVDKGLACPPVVSDGVAVFAGLDKKLYAVNIKTGEKRWAVGGSSGYGPDFVVTGGTVYARDRNTQLQALDLKTGQPRKGFASPRISTPPAAADGILYAGMGKSIVALDARTGQEKWRADAPGEFVRAPVVAGGVVCVAPAQPPQVRRRRAAGTAPVEPARIHAVDAKTGKAAWTHKAERGMPAALTSAGGRLYYRAGQTVVALDTEGGKELWAVAAPFPDAANLQMQVFAGGGGIKANDRGLTLAGGAPMTVADGVVYVRSFDTIRALDATSGQEKWTCRSEAPKQQKNAQPGNRRVVQQQMRVQVVMGPNGQRVLINGQEFGTDSPPTVAGGVMYYAAGDVLRAVDLKTRHERWTLEMAGQVVLRPIVAVGPNRQVVLLLGTSAPKEQGGKIQPALRAYRLSPGREGAK